MRGRPGTGTRAAGAGTATGVGEPGTRRTRAERSQWLRAPGESKVALTRQSFLAQHTGTPALIAFLAFYGVCFALTWAVYLRKPATAPVAGAQTEPAPQFGYAEV